MHATHACYACIIRMHSTHACYTCIIRMHSTHACYACIIRMHSTPYMACLSAEKAPRCPVPAPDAPSQVQGLNHMHATHPLKERTLALPSARAYYSILCLQGGLLKLGSGLYAYMTYAHACYACIIRMHSAHACIVRMHATHA